LAIRRRRDELGRTQEQVAEVGDLHHNFVSALERGAQSCTFDAMLRLAKGLDCRPSDLLKDAGY
jgi:transcriptional regulator with XRE-family HTH domain